MHRKLSNPRSKVFVIPYVFKAVGPLHVIVICQRL